MVSGSRPVTGHLSGVVHWVVTHSLAGPPTGHVVTTKEVHGPPGGGVTDTSAVVGPVGFASMTGALQQPICRRTTAAFCPAVNMADACRGYMGPGARCRCTTHKHTAEVLATWPALHGMACVVHSCSPSRGRHKVDGVGHRRLLAAGQRAHNADLILHSQTQRQGIASGMPHRSCVAKHPASTVAALNAALQPLPAMLAQTAGHTCVAGVRPVNMTSGVVLVTTTGLPPFSGVAVKVYCAQDRVQA